MEDNIIRILGLFNSRLWIIATILIVAIGIYLSIKLNFFQFNLIRMIKELIKKRSNTGGISPFKTLMLSLAGRIGVGSISGVALAIYIAGPGTIFWIWLISILSAPLAYAEVFLGIKYRERDTDNTYKGGPAYYIKKRLLKRKLGAIYSIIIIICYVIGFISIQANTITRAITEIINIDAINIGIILVFLTFLII